ncbi:hypothetical protein [Desulfosporosinus meridiei]|uniref:hypothetical protein n=1 Tax=Desulfosporosinus meridiei TaxID=79209 RepID=UPI0011D23BD6|nr:hypothetical protein [Desulfosporosinus meridiei]
MWALEQGYTTLRNSSWGTGGQFFCLSLGERFLAVLTRAKTVSSFCTRLRVPPLARWTVRERVRTSRYSCM